MADVRRNRRRSRNRTRPEHLVAAMFLVLWVSICAPQAWSFDGFEKPELPAVASDDWGLRIVVFNVGQADAILVTTPNGDVVLIDSGRYVSAIISSLA